jgi:hypothetical protein
VPSSRSKFSLLTDVPKPLPDAAEAGPAAAQEPEKPAEPRPAVRSRPPAVPATVPAVAPPAALTVRLRRSAAEPLQEAWLRERQLRDPKLSYPEFASQIVALGLAAFERRQARQA